MAWGKKKNPGYSYFAVSATLEGRLCFTGIIRLDGRVNGEIVSSGTLVVEETAIITGNVLVENIILSGTIHGNITAFKHVQLNASAKVYGHISYGELSIEGALHEGSSHKLTSEEVEEAHRLCLTTMEEATVKAECPKPDLISPEQSTTPDSAEKLTADRLTDQKPDTIFIRKQTLPPGKTNPAISTKPVENPAAAQTMKPASDTSTTKGGNVWSSVRVNNSNPGKNDQAKPVNPPASGNKPTAEPARLKSQPKTNSQS